MTPGLQPQTVMRALMLVFCIVQARLRSEQYAAAAEAVERRMQMRKRKACSSMFALTCVDASDASQPQKRRKVHRALGKWRGSTISGYLRGDHGPDELTYRMNFRMSIGAFNAMVEKLSKTNFDSNVDVHDVATLKKKAKMSNWNERADSALKVGWSVLDHPNTRYKCAVCLYKSVEQWGGRGL